jgi:methylmalonyl-CoA/ethylmalonyl-CoA epimerase
VGLNVENTRAAVRELEAKAYPFIPNPKPLEDDETKKARPFRDCEFAFIHPKKMTGVLVELIDYQWDELEK